MRWSSAWSGALAALALAACSGGSDDGGGGNACTPTCTTAGATRCSGAQMQTCRLGADGCLAWGEAAACAATQVCSAATNACVASRTVTLSWLPNRERGVNRAGGGYEIAIAGQPAVVVPYASGAAAPTSAAVRLPSGSYTATVRAFAALDPSGGSTRTYGAPSPSVVFIVP